MRVLYYHQHFSTPSGAAGTRSYEMAQKLIRHGHQVLMVCGSYQVGGSGLEIPFKRGRRRGNVDGIEVTEFELPYSNTDSLPRRARLFFRFALKSIRVAFTEDYDVVFATSTPLTAGIPGIVARWLRGKTFVFEVRDLWPELPRAMGVITNPVVLGLMSFLEWCSYHSAHRCIGLSPGIVAGIQSRGIPESRVCLVSNGCDLELFGGSASSALRPDGVSDTDLLAIFTGTHGVANGVDAALDAAAELKKRGREDIKLCFIGHGKLKPDLVQRAGREGLDNCIFMDSVPKKILAQYMRGADVGMQLLRNVPAFYYGTSPNKFFDYIAAGIPVLNNYPGWLAEMIAKHECGYVVPPENPQAFADALEKAADNRSELSDMGKNSRLLAAEKFNRDILSEKFVGWLEGR